MENELSKELKEHIVKTGTLTLGIICKDGIVVASDRRQSYGAPGGGVAYIAGKAKKIIEVNDEIIVTTAGNASDTRKFANLLRAELRLKELRAKQKVSIKQAANLLSSILYQSIRQPSMIPSIAHFILAGYDENGFHLYDISPDGYLREVEDYAASGAGFYQAHPILDSEYKEGMTIEQGKDLAIKSIKASLKREPSVGDGIDIYVVKNKKIEEVMSQEIYSEFKQEK